MDEEEEKDAPNEHKISYKGPIRENHKAQPQAPLSPEAARRVALSAWERGGRIRPTHHFRSRASQRGFTIIETEQVIRYGRCVAGVEACPEFRNYKYLFEAEIDGVRLRISFALDGTQDYQESPVLILISGVWKTKSGTREGKKGRRKK